MRMCTIDGPWGSLAGRGKVLAAAKGVRMVGRDQNKNGGFAGDLAIMSARRRNWSHDLVQLD